MECYPSLNKEGHRKKIHVSAHLCEINTGKIKLETKGIGYPQGECGKGVERSGDRKGTEGMRKE